MASEEPVYYRVHSMVRRVATRTKRQQSASRHRFVQRLAGGEITVRRARPATISAAQLDQHLELLKVAVEDGRIEVRTMVGAVVDLSTLKAAPVKETASPKADPPLDSAANDRTFDGGVGVMPPESQVLPDPDVNTPLASEGDEAVEAGSKDPAKVRGKSKESKGSKGSKKGKKGE